MEKKTIGAFIAALRKANGMTQKDLAVIPVIAAIFDVSIC